MQARLMRKMQVPAYCPFVVGDQDVEYRGLVKDSKNVIVISSIDMDMLSDMLVEVAIAMAVVVAIFMSIIVGS